MGLSPDKIIIIIHLPLSSARIKRYAPPPPGHDCNIPLLGRLKKRDFKFSAKPELQRKALSQSLSSLSKLYNFILLFGWFLVF